MKPDNGADGNGGFEADHYDNVGSVVVSGELMVLGVTDLFAAYGPAPVVVRSGPKVVAHGELLSDGTFSVEVPGDLVGELELRVGIPGAAPVVFAAGEPAELAVLVNQGGTNIA